MRRIQFDRFKPVEQPEEHKEPNGFVSQEFLHSVCNSLELTSVLRQLDPTKTLHWKSNGDWSMHQLFTGLINKFGACDVYISSYAVCETAARIFSSLKDQGLIKTLNCVFDNRVDTRSAGSMQLMKNICDTHALIPTHAKATILIGKSWQLAVIGSANYTENKRWEIGLITDNEEVINFHLSWIKQELNNATTN